MRLIHRSLASEVRSAALFRDCTTRELRRIERLATTVALRAGEYVCEEGTIGAEFFVIARGSAYVEQAGKRVRSLGPGEAVGDVGLLSRNVRCRRTATVVAAEPMKIFVFDRTQFDALLEAVPSVARRLLEHASTVALSIVAETAMRAAQQDHPSNGRARAAAGAVTFLR